MTNRGPGKTLQVGGTLGVSVEDNVLKIKAETGLVVVTMMDTQNQQVWMYHPLSGWYSEVIIPVGERDE